MNGIDLTELRRDRCAQQDQMVRRLRDSGCRCRIGSDTGQDFTHGPDESPASPQAKHHAPDIEECGDERHAAGPADAVEQCLGIDSRKRFFGLDDDMRSDADRARGQLDVECAAA
jgi:hypothetical protein